jgi:hypothetical protein
MTTAEKIINKLHNLGMFENQAKYVLELSKPKLKEQLPEYNIRWDRPADEYPEALIDLIFIRVKPVAYQWYEDNLPEAWNKSLFQSEPINQ